MPALQSSVGQLEFGPGVSSLSFGLSGATCGEPVVFSASSPEAWAEAVPASGQVPAGGAATITVRIDRRPIPSGGSTSLQISGGGTSLSVAIRVYPNLVVLPTAMPTRTFLTLRPTATPTSCLTPSACPP